MCVPCDSVMRADSPDDIFVITTDQEKAIIAGLHKSAMKEKALHVCCSLHAKWSKCLGDECLDVDDACVDADDESLGVDEECLYVDDE